MSTGKRIGYVRVSTVDQNPDRQLSGVDLDKKFIEYASGKNIKRPQLIALLDYVREDDIVVVHSMDRLARNVKELLDLIDQLNTKNVTVSFIKENMQFTGLQDHMSRLILTVMGAIAEFERQQILERQREGIAEAKKQGKYKGTKKKLNSEKLEILKKDLQTRKSISQIALDLGVSRFTLYRYIKEFDLKTGT
jgi:DNA invertase Pin-like site-specific DNA recombinase